jgi:hypothetical protein
MRKLGYLLLIVGFASVLMQASGRIKHAAWVARKQRDALPQQDSFSRQQVEEAIFRAALASRASDAAAILPGALMVCGGILLDRVKIKRNRQKVAA